jgi:UDP-N-acetylmuramate--alanine ligase
LQRPESGQRGGTAPDEAIASAFGRVRGLAVHLVGVAGQGMSALAEVLQARGAVVTGSDVDEPFFTTPVLERIGVPVLPFDPDNVRRADLVVFSAAYDPDRHPELLAARDAGLPLVNYPQALGALSAHCEAVAVCGTHGKTTITAMLGTLLDGLELPATVLVGSPVASFGDRSTLNRGTELLAAETCEYRRHFLHYHPDRIVLSGVEWEHVDYFADYRDTVAAFVELCRRLPPGGELVYDADDAGAATVATAVAGERDDVVRTPVGRTAPGAYRMDAITLAAGRTVFRLAAVPGELTLRVPGAHSAKDAALAVAAATSMHRRHRGGAPEPAAMAHALSRFSGTRRRSEVVGEAGGVTFVEDYGHHPTEIRVTLSGLRRFFGDRPLVVDFMPHTFSRTGRLLEDFATVFGDAERVILHDIYASARERNDSGVSGEDLFRAVSRRHPSVAYTPGVDDGDAVQLAQRSVGPGDVFVTMGAGDNWKLGARLRERLLRADRTR